MSKSTNTQLKPDQPVSLVLNEPEKEIRYELSSLSFSENLCYIGIVLHEAWQVVDHIHQHFELCYVDKGQGWFSIDGAYYKLNEGDLFLTKPGERHRGMAEGELPFRLYYFGFQLDDMRPLELDYYKIGMNRVERDEQATIKRICDHIFEELQDSPQQSKLMVQGLLTQMLVSVLRIFHARPADECAEPVKISSGIVQILDYLHSNVRPDHKVEQLAEKIYISRSHLSREFKRFVGVSVCEYNRSLCIDKAKHLLRESDDTVSRIAEQLHFPTIHLFSIFFKRHAGLSPRQFRSTLRSGSNNSTNV